MTKIDFYILNTGSQEHTACRLVEKAYNLGHKIYIHTQSEEHSRQVDELLWTFRDGSFIPHECHQAGAQPDSPIVIGHEDAPESHTEVLINLAPAVPLFFSRFLRVAEVIGHDEQAKQQGRDRFKFYRDRGYPMDTHNL